jgi:hypothetical protein
VGFIFKYLAWHLRDVHSSVVLRLAVNDLKAGAGQVRCVTLVVLPLNMPVTVPEDHFTILNSLISTHTTRDGHEPLAWHLQDVHSSIVLE